MKKITEKTTLKEILEIKGAEDILAKYNMPCLTCPMAEVEMKTLTLGQICQMYGINLEKLLKEVNELTLE